MSYIDIGIIVIVALCALIGLKKGLFKSLMSLFGWLVTFAVAFFLTKTIAYALLDVSMVANFVAGTGGGFSLYNWVSGWGWISDIGAMPAFILTLVEPLMGSINASVAAGVFNLTEGLALYLAYYIYCIIVFVALFIIIKIVVSILLLFIKTLVDKKEKPGGLSRLLGFVVGAIKGGVYVVLILLVFGYASAIPQLNSFGAKIDESMVGAPVYKQVKTLSEKFLSNSDEDTITKLVGIAGITPTDPVEEEETETEVETETENENETETEVENGTNDDDTDTNDDTDTE